MKWYDWLILLVLLLAAFFLGYAWEWYNSPMGEPFCLEPDYLGLWSAIWREVKIAGAAALVALVLLVACVFVLAVKTERKGR